MQYQCVKCNEVKDEELFYRHRRAKTGRMSSCKECKEAYDREPVNKARRLARQQKARRTNGIDRVNSIYHTLRKSIKSRNLEFTLTKDWIQERLTKGKCEVTGIGFVVNPDECVHTVTTSNNRQLNPFSPSVDRVDNSEGYTPENCKMVVSIYNYAKLSFKEESLKLFCQEYLKYNER